MNAFASVADVSAVSDPISAISASRVALSSKSGRGGAVGAFCFLQNGLTTSTA